MENKKYTRVDKPSDRKLIYNSQCSKCKKDTDQRFTGGTYRENFYKCIKCKTKNTEVI